MAKEKKAILIMGLAIMLGALASGAEAQAVIAQGGYITPLNISSQMQTRFWQGIPGRINIIPPFAPTQVNATGGHVNRTDFNITSPCAKPISITGFILFSNSSSIPVGLKAGDLTQLDAIMVGSKTDNATSTFKENTTFNIGGATINNVPTTHTNVNKTSQNVVFREGYLNDAAGNIIIAVEADINTQGYNSSYFDFQAMLPALSSKSTIYYTSTALNIICPKKGRAAPGGRGYTSGCSLNWTCTDWGACTDGLQTRECYPITNCRFNLGVIPSLSRQCAQVSSPTTMGEAEIVDMLHKQKINISIPATIYAYIGEEIQIPVTVHNPNIISIEQVSILAEVPQTMQNYLSLHTAPKFYKTFGLITLQPLRKEMSWSQTAASIFRLNPMQTEKQPVSLLAPMIHPQVVTAAIDTYAGDVSLATTQTQIVLETKPFMIAQQKRGKTTDIEIVIDNRGQKARTAEVELDFNKGRSTVFTEIYTLDLPADEIALFGYTYGTLFDYDHIKARYEKYTAEV